MSQENVEVVRSYVETFSSADLTPSDWSRFVADFLDPDADYYPARKFPEARPCHGVEQILRFRADYRDAWDGFEVVVKKMIPVGDDRVLVHSTIRAEGRESGAKLDGDFYMCMWLRHGRIFRCEDHLTPQGALRALGLSGETLEAAGLRE
jgi:ketosteroid isomerase-like protein